MQLTGAEDNSPHPVAGKWFSLRVTLLDQWGSVFDMAGLSVSASLDVGNTQGAVLWGLRSNVTDSSGSTVLQRVVVSQPGAVELRLHTSTPTAAAAAAAKRASPSIDAFGSKNERSRVLISALKLLVRQDVNAVDPAPCLFVFQDMSSILRPGAGEDADALYPAVQGYLPALYYGRLLACQDALRKWHVDHWMAADGRHVLQYRAGISAIWTGTHFPSLEQSPEERLGLVGLEEQLRVLLAATEAEEVQETLETLETLVEMLFFSHQK